MPFLSGLLLLLLLFLSGCSVHPPMAKPPAHLPTAFQTAGADMVLLPGEQWWLSFADPHLNAIMADCFAANLDIAMAFARLEQVAELEKSQNATLWPEVSALASAGRGKARGLEADTYTLSVGASYELDLWQKLKYRRQAAAFTREAQADEVQFLFLSLAAQVAESYYQLVELRQLLRLNEELINSFQDTVELVDMRYRLGVVGLVDLYQARQNLLAAKAEYPLLQAEERRLINRLALLVGKPAAAVELGELALLPDLHHSFATGLPADLLLNRPDVAAALARLQGADQEIGAAVASRFPALQLTANYGGQNSEIADILVDPNIFWNLLVNISQPIIDGGRRKSEVRRRQAVFNELAAGYQKSVLTALAEVDDALSLERGVDDSLVILVQREEVTRATLELALLRYEQGITDFLPVLTAQTSQASARISLIKGQRQRISSRIQLARALGGSWMSEELDKGLTRVDN
ncbi:MAG: efflux transporter outer membrane subunit [Thermodesulfobacteriota bacterium]